MSLDSEQSTLDSIDRWFQNRCDGLWEHRFGVKIETTDNPGWLLTFDDLSLDAGDLANVVGPLLRDYGAQVSTDGAMVRVFASSLAGCLASAAQVASLGDDRGGEQDKPC